jgi:hypothetical protein
MDKIQINRVTIKPVKDHTDETKKLLFIEYGTLEEFRKKLAEFVGVSVSQITIDYTELTDVAEE